MNTSINNLIEKYWAGETSLEEERLIKTYFMSGNVSEEHEDMAPLFDFFSIESEITVGDLDLDLEVTKPKPKVRRLFPRLLTIAASMAILISASMLLFNNNSTIYKNKYTELQDPEEALEITMEALGFLSNKYEQGSEPMTKYMKNLEKTVVFEFNDIPMGG